MTAIGILGGTFNPVHIGHLRGGIAARDALGLEALRFMPASLPPLKHAPAVSASHRMAMLALALAGLPGLSVDGRELERAGPSYTIDSLHEIRETMGPTASITFILGGDSVAQLHRWHRWREITSLVNLAILSRPGAPEVEDAEVLAWLKEHELAIDQWQQPEKGAVCWLEQPLLDVSSSVLRDMIARRKNVSFLLPAAVIEYIENHGLYRF